MNLARALPLLLPLACAPGFSYPSSDPAKALVLAGSAALATAADAPKMRAAAREPRREPRPAPPSGPMKVHVVAPEPRPRPPEPTTIDGWVVADRGATVPFAVIKLTHGQAPGERVRADAQGRFHVPPPLLPGRYAMEVRSDRWEGAAEVEVVPGVRTNQWIKVHPRRPERGVFW